MRDPETRCALPPARLRTCHWLSTLHSGHWTASRPLLDRAQGHRFPPAAARFLRKAIDQCGTPEKITIDKSGANAAAIEEYNTDNEANIELRQVRRRK